MKNQSQNMTGTILKMAARNLKANWKHSLAAILSLAAGFVAICLFESYFIRVKVMYRETFAQRSMYGDLLIEKHGAQTVGQDDLVGSSLSEADQAGVQKILDAHASEIADQVRSLRLVGTAQSGSNNAIFMGYGYDVASGERLRGESWRWNVNAGAPLKDGAGDQLLLGKALAANLGCQFDAKTTSFTAIGYYPAVERPFKCGSRISLSVATDQGQMNALFLNVAGISDAGFSEIDSRFAAMPLATAQKLMNTHRISMISVKAKPGVDKKLLISRLNAEAAASGLALDIRDWADHPYGDLYVRTLDYLDIFRGFVMIVILFIVSMSVLNTFMKLVVERTKEIGTLRSLGFLPSVIVRMFAAEGLFLAGLGTGIGAVAALIGTVLINTIRVPYKAGILSEPVPFIVAFAPSLYVIVAVFLGAFAALTAVIASWKQARLKISDALAT